MRSEISSRPAVMEDLPGILTVARLCIEAPSWPEDRYRAMLKQDAAALQKHAVFVAEEHQRVLGFAVVAVVSGEAELESVAVRPEARRLGIGRELCRAVMSWSAEQGADRMWLEVRLGSLGAHALYRQLGFITTRVRRNYYANPVEDAVLMCANLQQLGHL